MFGWTPAANSLTETDTHIFDYGDHRVNPLII